VVAFGLSKSCYVVLKLLTESETNQAKIIADTNLSARTVKYALRRLEGKKLISVSQDLFDLRRKRYSCKDKMNVGGLP